MLVPLLGTLLSSFGLHTHGATPRTPAPFCSGQQGSFLSFTAQPRCLPLQALHKYVLDKYITDTGGGGGRQAQDRGLLQVGAWPLLRYTVMGSWGKIWGWGPTMGWGES